MNPLKQPLFYVIVFAIGYFPLFQSQEIEVTLYPDQLQESQSHEVASGNYFFTKKNEDGSVTIHTYTTPSSTRFIISFVLISLLFYFGGLSRWQKPKKKKELEKEIEHIESHPRYQEFLASNPENKHIYKEETASAFYKWLNENEANQSAHTTPASAPR